MNSGSGIDSKNPPQENQLILELKSICDENGKEIYPEKSAHIFHKLSQIYKRKSPCMISLIRSVALINAALARSSSNTIEIENDLEELCRLILLEADAKDKEADLVSQSKKTKLDVISLREKVTLKLRKISPIPQISDKTELTSLEIAKIKDVRSLQDEIASDYTLIMSDLAHYCEKIMGKPPCKFTLVGLGSLARREITPYSDFENIIVLDEKLSINLKYLSVVDYFKWFSVIFQTVLINLQETILPSVFISQLNDPSCEHGDWFFDGTTRGVSFDGMMPHACKFPLGRQQLTENKPWKTELIKPVSEMLKYLKSEESQKNGYHLSDILTKISFVYGDRNLFNQFEKGIFDTIHEQENSTMLEELKLQLITDLNNFATRSTLFEITAKNFISVKRDVYRSTTIFVSALGRIYNLKLASCFDIINCLADREKISKLTQHKLMYAVALACEIRLRWYMQKKSQNDIIDIDLEEEKTIASCFLNIVGKQSTISYFQIAYALQCYVSKRLNLDKLYFYLNPQLLNISIYYSFGDKKQILILLQNQDKDVGPDVTDDFDKCLRYLENNSSILNSNISTESVDDFGQENIKNTSLDIAKNFETMGDILCKFQCYEDAVEYFHEAGVILQEAETQLCSKRNSCGFELEKIGKKKAYNFRRVAHSLFSLGKFRAALIFLENSANIEQPATSNTAPSNTLPENRFESDSILALCKLGQCYMEIGNYEDALIAFQKALNITGQTPSDNEINEDIILHDIGSCLIQMNDYGNALNFLKRSLAAKRLVSTDDDISASAATLLRDIGCCYMKMNNFSDAIHYLEQSLQAKEFKSTDVDSDTSLSFNLREIGSWLTHDGKFGDAVTYYERLLEILKRTSPDASIDKDIAFTLHELGNCLRQMSRFSDALDCLKKSLIITTQLSMDINTDRQFAFTLHEIGSCLGHLKQFDPALQKLNQAVDIIRRTSEDVNNDRNVAKILLEIGRCHLNAQHYDDAFQSFKESLQISENTAVYINTDQNIAEILLCLGQCSCKLEKPTDALSCINQSLAIYRQLQSINKSDTHLRKCITDVERMKRQISAERC